MDFLLSLCPDIILRLWQNHPFAAGLVTGLAIAYGSGYAFHRWASANLVDDLASAKRRRDALADELLKARADMSAAEALRKSLESGLADAKAENERLAKELAEQKEKGKGQAGIYAVPMEDIDPYGAMAIGKYF